MTDTRRVVFTTPDKRVQLEGRLTEKGGRRGIVIAHPHPLYGGDMDNPVVVTLAETFSAAGWNSLRFNFRGVGGSSGRYDEGRGEIEDLLAARKRLAESGSREIFLAGYSFGAWIIARAAAKNLTGEDRLLLVAPPVALLEFPPTLRLPHLVRVITGENDDIAPPRLLERAVAEWNPAISLTVIPGCDHFYSGRLQTLARVLNPDGSDRID